MGDCSSRRWSNSWYTVKQRRAPHTMQLGLNRDTFKDLENTPQLIFPGSSSMPRNTFNHGQPQLTSHSCKPLLGLFGLSQNSRNDPPVKFYLPSYAPCQQSWSFFLYIFELFVFLPSLCHEEPFVIVSSVHGCVPLLLLCLISLLAGAFPVT